MVRAGHIAREPRGPRRAEDRARPARDLESGEVCGVCETANRVDPWIAGRGGGTGAACRGSEGHDPEVGFRDHGPHAKRRSTEGAQQASPGQRPGSAKLRRKALKGRDNSRAAFVPPLQGCASSFAKPRALPWAGLLPGLWPSRPARAQSRFFVHGMHEKARKEKALTGSVFPTSPAFRAFRVFRGPAITPQPRDRRAGTCRSGGSIRRRPCCNPRGRGFRRRRPR